MLKIQAFWDATPCRSGEQFLTFWNIAVASGSRSRSPICLRDDHDPSNNVRNDYPYRHGVTSQKDSKFQELLFCFHPQH